MFDPQDDGPVARSAIAAERVRLERAGRLQSVLWAIILLSGVLAILAWRFSLAQVDARAEQRFDRQASQVIDNVRGRLDDYVHALRGSGSFFAASNAVSVQEWHTYTASLQLDTRFPALRALAVAFQVPADSFDDFVREERLEWPAFAPFPAYDGPVHLPLTRVWPASFEARIIGLDLASEPRRRDAFERARATGLPQITGLVPLGASGRSGLVLMTTFGRPQSDSATSARREGVTVAVMLAAQLLDGLSDEITPGIAISVRDGDEVIHRDDRFEAQQASARFQRRTTLPFFGRDWTFEMRTTPSFHAQSETSTPTVVLLAGLSIDALLAAMFIVLTRSNRRALAFAGRAGSALAAEREELAQSNRELEAANAELERFGHALSHDLRTPLNGIETLVEFIEDDIAEPTGLPEMRDGVQHQLGRVRRQVHRGKTLIDGMLAYAGLGADTDADTVSRVEVRALLLDIADALDLDPERLHLPPSLPSLDTCEIRLGQVFGNLIGNALKYHHDPANARIDIEVAEQGAWLRFAVVDDGPGIEPAYRDKVFELFQTLQSRDDSESSGIGLSIVKKAVEQAGGDVRVDASACGGARFEFTWPRVWPTALSVLRRAA